MLTITPFIFPIAMAALGLLTGMVQAYIFSYLGGGLHRGGDARAQVRDGTRRLAPIPDNFDRQRGTQWTA